MSNVNVECRKQCRILLSPPPPFPNGLSPSLSDPSRPEAFSLERWLTSGFGFSRGSSFPLLPLPPPDVFVLVSICCCGKMISPDLRDLLEIYVIY